eukprot:310098-Prymnesium_polylepis.1
MVLTLYSASPVPFPKTFRVRPRWSLRPRSGGCPDPRPATHGPSADILLTAVRSRPRARPSPRRRPSFIIALASLQ